MKIQFNTKFILTVILLFAILLISYSNHFQNTFHFDDSHAIQSNPYIRSLDNLPKFLYSPEMFSSLPSHWGLRPLVSMSLAIDYWIGGGLNPFYFQLSTFIWFCLMLALLFFVIRKIIGLSVKTEWTHYAALFILAWYGLHTANAETINYIISRSDVLSTFFIVLSFGIYILAPTKRKYFLYIIPAMIGVLAKETVLTLVIILFFYVNLFEKDISLKGHFEKKNFNAILNTILNLLPLFFCVAAVQYYTLSKMHSTTDMSNPLGYYLLTESYVWLKYFIAFFIPANLSADSDWGVIRNIFDERIIIGLTFLVILIYFIFKTSNKKETRPISFGLIWFAVTLLPSSVVPFAEVTNDHRMFFSFIGLALAVGYAIYLWVLQVKETTANSKWLQIGVLLAVFLVLGLNAYGVYKRNIVWRTEESLWFDVTVKSPANGRGLMNYGLTQMEKGNYADAEIYFEKALIYNPYYEALFTNIGVLKGAMGKSDEAIISFKKSILFNRRSSHTPYYFYARYLKNQGSYEESEQIIKQGIAINPYSIDCLIMLAYIYYDTQQWDKLVEVSNKILKIDATSVEGNKLLKSGTERKPIGDGKAKKQLSAQDYVNQSLVLYNKKVFQKCVDVCLEALKLDPKNVGAYNNIGAAYIQMAQWQKAIDALTQALIINPNHKLAKGNLNWAKSELAKTK
jgi:protein O-mannosyl-transferase